MPWAEWAEWASNSLSLLNEFKRPDHPAFFCFLRLISEHEMIAKHKFKRLQCLFFVIHIAMVMGNSLEIKVL